jgi:hypothetical protein
MSADGGTHSGASIFKAVQNFVSAPGSDPTKWEKLLQPEFVPLERYYGLVSETLRQANNSSSVLSNGWAFCSRTGVAIFEDYISSDNTLRDFYLDRKKSLPQAASRIKEHLGSKTKLGGVMIYGYGNLIRESQLVDCLKTENVLSSGHGTIYLLDCSLFYHIMAESKINPMLRHLKRKWIKTRLIDFVVTDDNVKRIIKDWRADIYLMRPTLHVFFGNTFCNLETKDLQRIVSEYILPGDYVLAEYANYPDNFFRELSNDHSTNKYLTNMARVAAAEIFSINKGDVTLTHQKYSEYGKCVEVRIRANNETITFKSLLRRKYNSTEVGSLGFSLLEPMKEGGDFFIDLYQRQGA